MGDRFVQLTPVYGGGEVLADGVILDEDRTAVPLELDEIYSGLDKLNVALGPNGANKNGALTDLLEVTAENFGGQGAKFHQTIEDFSKLSQTLDNNKEELFGSAEELQGFINTLATNDKTVRSFNQSLAAASTMLSGERQELSAALRNLAEAMTQVSSFVKQNRDLLGKNISGLNRVTKVLVKQRGALNEILGTAPLALNNLYLTYNPQAGTLDTSSNTGEIDQPARDGPGDAAVRFREPGRHLRCRLRRDPECLPAQCHLRQESPGQHAGHVRSDPRRPRGGSAMKRLKVVLAVMATSLMLSGCEFDVYKLPLPGGPDVGSNPITIRAEFRDVMDLVPKSTVKVNDVSVGQVTDVDLDGYTADVTIELRNDTELPDNAIAEIRQTSLLGEKFVSLSAPAAGASSNMLEHRRRHPAVEPPVATPRSKRSWARSACCSTAAAWPSSRPSPRS